MLYILTLQFRLLFLFFIFIYAAPANSVASNSQLTNNEILEKLKLADTYRLTAPSKFKNILKTLNKIQSSFNAEQKSYHQYLKGYYSAYHGEHEKADSLLTDVLNSSTSALLKFRANYTLISVSAAAKNWTKGLEHIAINNKLRNTIDNIEHYQTSLLTTITFYNQLLQYELVLSNIAKLRLTTLSDVNQCYLGQFYLEAKLKLNQLQSKDPKIGEAIKICDDANSVIGANIIRIYKSRLHLKEGHAEKSLALILPYVEEINNTLFSTLIAGMNNNLAKAYLLLNDLDNAKAYALQALATNKANTIIQQGVDTYKLLYEIEKRNNNTELALIYHEKYSELDREHLEGEKAKHLAFQFAEHQAFEHEAEIKLLNEKNTLLETKQALSDAEVANTRLIIAFLVVSLILITLWGGRLYKAHKRIKELAEYDALTGIFNRGHFTHVANSALKYCQNAEQDISVIIFDLDYFKTVNDSYGHATGDWALKEATRVCKNLGRKNDIFARIGGEEFCILLPSCNIRSAALRAEECRHAIEDIITEASGHDFRITASFGVTDAKTSGFNLEKLLADADEAAYTSKHSGRNRVTVYEVETTPKQAQLDGSWSIS